MPNYDEDIAAKPGIIDGHTYLVQDAIEFESDGHTVRLLKMTNSHGEES